MDKDFQAVSERAQENHRRILELKTQASKTFILLSKELKENRDKRYFEVMGYPTFELYIESPLVDLHRRSVYSLIAIYEKFVEELGYPIEELATVDYSKLDRLLPVLNVQPVAHGEWVEKAKKLTRRELEENIRDFCREARQRDRLPPSLHSKLPQEGLASWLNTVQQGDALLLLQELPSSSIDMYMTSPPYWALRDYGVSGQLGLEATFQEYTTKLCDIFDEVKRVLKEEGTCWVNIGDTYAGSGNGANDYRLEANKSIQGVGKNAELYKTGGIAQKIDYPKKSLCLIPSRFAIEMVSRGWILRNEIIWHKPNCMPSSVKDRFTIDFERIFFFAKSTEYRFEMQYEEHTSKHLFEKRFGSGYKIGYKNNPHIANSQFQSEKPIEDWFGKLGRNRRCVWTIPTQPFPNAHFATFPEKLVETPIKAGCPQNGIVLDPFAGAGTTLVVAHKLGRNYLGFEINPEYVAIARKRLEMIVDVGR